MKRGSFLFAFASCVTALSHLSRPLPAYAAAEGSPEKQTLEISRILHPISDEEWQTIAGAHSTVGEKYKIESGDTLFGISKRLFGDPGYWPKIWAMNNDTILNPHLILPGHEINFMPGTGISLPKVSIDTNTTPENGPYLLKSLTELKHVHSNDWKKYPEQPWEYAGRFNKSNEIDAITVSQSLTKNFAAETSAERPYQVYSEPLPAVADLSQSPDDNVQLSIGNQVFLHPRTELEDGKTYSISPGPEPIHFEDPAFDENQPSEHRSVYVYRITGELIAHDQNGLWIGTIINSRSYINRGDLLIPQMPRLQPTTPVPASSAVEGHYYVDPGSVYLAVSGHYGLVDIGSKDGAAEGMLFQSYQSRDPVQDKNLVKKDFFDRTTLQIVQTADYFSFVKVIAGKTEIADGDLVKLLIDVSAFGGPPPIVTPVPEHSEEPLPEPTAETPPPDSGNQLDNLNDGSEKLSPDEERELKQLEKYKPEESQLSAPTASPSPAPSPSIEEIPPPPPETAPAPEANAPAPTPTPNNAEKLPSTPPSPPDEPLPAPDSTPAPIPDTTPAPIPDSTPAITPEEPMAPSDTAPINPPSSPSSNEIAPPTDLSPPQ
jgi:hypothetical protein